MNALEMIDRELERAAAPKSTNKRPIFLFLKEGHTARIRPLYNLSEALVLRKHNKWHNDQDQRVNAICAGEEMKDCHYCQMSLNDKKLQANVVFYLPIYVYAVVDSSGEKITYKDPETQEEKPVQGVRLLEMTSFGTIGAVLKYFRQFLRDPDNGGTITGCDFTITQSGSGQQKTFVCMNKAFKPMPEGMRKIIPSHETIQRRIIEALPPLVSAEEEQFDRQMAGGNGHSDPAIAAVVQGVKNGQKASQPQQDEEFEDAPDF